MNDIAPSPRLPDPRTAGLLRRRILVLVAAGAAMAGTAVAPVGAMPQAGPDLDAARRMVDERPDDPGALLALGRAHLARPDLGRFRALELFREAARLLPDDPEPRYWIGRAGLALLGSDGEAIARRGLEGALALDPGYRDAWSLWLALYRGPGQRERMLEILHGHAGDPVVDARRARLLVEDGRCAAADSVLERLGEREPGDPRYPAWRADCAFARGRDAEGLAHYRRAISLAHRDTGDVLWLQVATLARPDERAGYDALRPRDRPAFYRGFWAPRDPDVRTPANERIPEHFRRRRIARERYRLLHPLSRYHHVPRWRDFVTRIPEEVAAGQRSLFGEAGVRIARAVAAAGVPGPPGAARSGLPGTEALVARDEVEATERLTESLLGPGGEEPGRPGGPRFDPSRRREAARSAELLPVGRNLPEMLDDRGIAYIRHGEPDRISHPSESLDEAVWRYRGDPPLVLRFARGHRPPTPPISDMIHRPATREQARSVQLALLTGRSSIPAPLRLSFWFARFRHPGSPEAVDLFLFPAPGIAATGVLWDGAGREVARGDGEGPTPLRLSAAPGRLALALDGVRNDSLGRYRGIVDLPDLSGDEPTLSDPLLTADPGSRPLDRRRAAASALPGLRVSATRAFGIYVEAYGLPEEGGRHRYTVEYRFTREEGWLASLFGRDRTTLRFRREAPASEDGIVRESIRVEGGRLDPGRYALTVRLRSGPDAAEIGSRTVRITVGR